MEAPAEIERPERSELAKLSAVATTALLAFFIFLLDLGRMEAAQEQHGCFYRRLIERRSLISVTREFNF